MKFLRYQTIIRILFILLLAWLSVWHVDFAELRNHITPRFLTAFFVVQLPVALNLALHGIRHVLLAQPPRAPMMIGVKSMYLFVGLNMMLPARLGELVKATYLRDRAGVPMVNGLGAAMTGHLFDIISLAMVGLIAVVLSGTKGESGLGMISALFVGGVAVMVSMPVLVRTAGRLPLPRRLSFLRSPIVNVLAHCARSHGSLRIMTEVAILTLLEWGLSIVTVVIFIAVFFDQPLDTVGAMLVLAGIIIGGAIPGLPGGLGTFEVGAVVALISRGYDLEQAIPLAFGLHIALILQALMVTLIILMRERIGYGKLLKNLYDAARQQSKDPAKNDS